MAAFIILLIGTLILVPSFAFQLFKIYKKGKHTIGFSQISWTMNFVGRFMWLPFSFMAIVSIEPNNLDWMKLAAKNSLLFGQGLIVLMNVPILYYTFRNKNTDGKYTKVNFNKQLFRVRIVLAIVVVLAIIGFGIATNLVNNEITFSPEARKIAKTLVIIFGFSASITAGLAFLPQGIKVIKTQITTSTSFLLALMFSIGNTLLVLSFVVDLATASDKQLHDVQYVLMDLAVIIFPAIATLIMYVITFVKAKNMIKNGEK